MNKYKHGAVNMLWDGYQELLPHVGKAGGLAKILFGSIAGTIEPMLYSLDNDPEKLAIIENRILDAANRIKAELERTELLKAELKHDNKPEKHGQSDNIGTAGDGQDNPS